MAGGFSLWPAFGSKQGGAQVPASTQVSNNPDPRQTQLDPKNTNGIPDNRGGNADATDPNASADPKNAPQGSPLDGFEVLFQTPKDDKGQPIAPPADPFAAPFVEFDPKALKEATGKMNFAGVITPELAQRIFEQRDPAALAEVVNNAARSAFMAATTASQQFTERGSRAVVDRFSTVLPAKVRDIQISQAPSGNAAFDHPAAQPILQGIRAQIAFTNPNLPAERVNAMAEQYLHKFAEQMGFQAPADPASPKNKKPVEMDWNAFMTGTQPGSSQ